jgi:hypothetical protein
MSYKKSLIAIGILFSGAVAAPRPLSVDQVVNAFREARAAVPEARIRYTRVMLARANNGDIREQETGELLLTADDFALRVISTDQDANPRGVREVIWVARGNRLISVDTGTENPERGYDVGSMHGSPEAHLASSDCILNVWHYRRGLPIHEFLQGSFDRRNIKYVVKYQYPAPRDHIITLQIRIESVGGELKSIGEMDIDPRRGMLIESQRTFRIVNGERQLPPLTEVSVREAREMGGSGVWFPTEVTLRAGLAESRFVVSHLLVEDGEFGKSMSEILGRPVLVRGQREGEYYLLDRQGELAEKGGAADDEAAQRMLDEYLKNVPD